MKLLLLLLGSWDGAVVRALASHQCVPGSIPGTGVMWVEFVVGSRPSSEGFSPGSLVFLPPQKPTFLNSNLIRNSRATGLSVEDCYVLPSLNKVNLFIYLFICCCSQEIKQRFLLNMSALVLISIKHQCAPDVFSTSSLNTDTRMIRTLWDVPLGIRINRVPLYYRLQAKANQALFIT